MDATNSPLDCPEGRPRRHYLTLGGGRGFPELPHFAEVEHDSIFPLDVLPLPFNAEDWHHTNADDSFRPPENTMKLD